MRRAALLALAALLAACRGAPVAFEDSPYAVIPPGSTLMLTRDLTIPAERASLFVQGGEVRPYADVNSYYPHCRLEVERVLDTPQVVKADTFVIEKIVRQDIPRLADARIGALDAAGDGNRGNRLVTASDAGDAGTWTYATHFRLRSARQPEVRELTCQDWEDPVRAVHLTLRQIRQALGGLFVLQLGK